MSSDIEIARKANMEPILEIGAKLDICLLYTSDAADED